MKQKALTCFALLLALTLALGCAAAEISVGKKDLAQNGELTQDVTNILFLLQDGETTQTLLVASINGKTGRSVMTSLDCELVVPVQDAQETALGAVYALGDEKSRGYLAVRTVNQLLGLNIGTYIALDVARLPELVEAVGALEMELSEQDAAALGLSAGENELDGEQALAYVRLDGQGGTRGYDALMQLLRQGMHSGNVMGLVGLGTKLLSSLDTNLNPLSAMTLVGAVQSGEDRRELSLPEEEQILSSDPLTADAGAMSARFSEEVYE
ncbi:MAG: LCP family protein [Clostridia bacterium]|nr:LCP family protein [Clostridia bacterium]